MIVVWCILISFSLFHITCSIDVDYYYGPPRRNKYLTCGRFHQVSCQIKCGVHSSLCIKNECYCMNVIYPDHNSSGSDSLTNYDTKFEYGERSGIEKNDTDKEKYSHTTLRHQIAHFCPNLDIARACIRKCLAMGKPAFCGKDHVCYCGHKYTNMDSDSKINTSDLYAQFKDLYTKYFGPNINADNDSS